MNELTADKNFVQKMLKTKILEIDGQTMNVEQMPDEKARKWVVNNKQSFEVTLKLRYHA